MAALRAQVVLNGGVLIDRLGSGGDGLAAENGRTVAVPFALPGERVLDGRIVPSSPDRVEPVCRHFGPEGDRCGNCAVQHLAREPMLLWKRDLVVSAFRRAGVEARIGETVPVPLRSRRRVAFAVTPDGLGYHRRASAETFTAGECPILVPEVESNLAPLARLAHALGHAAMGLVVTACDNGLDVQVVASRPPNDGERRGLVRLREAPVIRVGVNDEVVVAAETPVVRFGDVSVTPPLGAFLQATRVSQEAMAALVTEHVGGSKRTADLFAGCGTFALRLPGQVAAFEGDAAALGALEAAANAAGRPVACERRDLHERPLTAAELDRFDAVVLDPPRAGARAQCEQLAGSRVARVAYVSCNPATLARDAAALIEGGHRLRSVTPVDQFLFSAEVEAVALFERAKEKRRRPLFG